MKLYLTSLKLTGLTQFLEKNPSETEVLFIPTAANTYKDKSFMERDREWFLENGFLLTEFDLVGKSKSEVESAISIVDLAYMSGGNCFYLLDQVRKSGFDTVVKNQLKRNFIYAGGSAGAVVAGMSIEIAKDFDDPDVVPNMTDFSAMKLVNFSILPHYGKAKYKELFTKALESVPIESSPILTLTDDQALLVDNNHYQIIEM